MPHIILTADFGNKDSALSRRVQLGGVITTVPHDPLNGGQSHPYYARRLSRVGEGD